MAVKAVSMTNINKSFPGVKALDNVRFDLEQGEVMALLGENGAGKSTLVKIISGVYNRDSGEVKVYGEDMPLEMNVIKAQDMGVSIIHQELNMCQHLTVRDNMFLGREIVKGGRLDFKEMNRQTRDVLAKLGIENINPNEIVGKLTVALQQMIEIAKALLLDSKILVMDEPTSSLSDAETEDLFKIVRELKLEGRSIIYISHKLQELCHIVDRVTIMRDGQYITEGNLKDFTTEEIIANMVGREITEQYPREANNRSEKVLEVRDLYAGKMVKGVSFEAYAGEVLGFAGLVGAGRTETMRALIGADPIDGGEVIFNGKVIQINSPKDAIDSSIVLVPEDRKKEGLCTRLTVKENIALPNLGLISKRFHVVDRKAERDLIAKSQESLNIKMPNADVAAASLSGGNQQKVVVAKWLAQNSKVIIFDEPTRGIDVAAKVEIYEIINQLKQNGVVVIVVSSELQEVMGIADRIYVMCEGRITGEVDARNTSEEEIMTYATQYREKAI